MAAVFDRPRGAGDGNHLTRGFHRADLFSFFVASCTIVSEATPMASSSSSRWPCWEPWRRVAETGATPTGESTIGASIIPSGPAWTDALEQHLQRQVIDEQGGRARVQFQQPEEKGLGQRAKSCDYALSPLGWQSTQSKTPRFISLVLIPRIASCTPLMSKATRSWHSVRTRRPAAWRPRVRSSRMPAR